ncbi:hypothetical protein CLERM_437 [Coxiella-like endosymbiont]|nr:hypothetical protein CLERM_437 [Coxiella-like endosymbiont]
MNSIRFLPRNIKTAMIKSSNAKHDNNIKIIEFIDMAHPYSNFNN